MSVGVSLKDLLKTKHFRKNCYILAGEKGLSNLVSWVHVLEIHDAVKDSVYGQELILTTGIGFETKEIAVKFVRELIDLGVSGICIETVLYYRQVDQELIDIAEQYDFPLIVITESSRFIDITRDLNSIILGNDEKLYQNADYFDRQIGILRRKGNIEDCIKYTAEYLDLHVGYLSQNGNILSSSSSGFRKIFDVKVLETIDWLEDDEIYCTGNIAVKLLKMIGRNWGYLVFCSPRKNIAQFETIILRRFSNRLKNDISAELINNEKRLYQNNEWLKFWLQGKLADSTAQEKIREAGIFQRIERYIVCLVELPLENSDSNIKTKNKLFGDFLLHTTIIGKKVFKDEGFFVLGHMETNRISYVILIPNEAKEVRAGLDRAIEQLRFYQNQFINYSDAVFSFGKEVTAMKDLAKSYETALFALNVVQGKKQRIVYYEQLYISRVMEQLRSLGFLREFIVDHMGALLEPANAELLHTLRTYYECKCSKQKTAEKLYIVRQSLYVRLTKLEDILGKDFDEGEKRLALEFAVNALAYLENKELTEINTI